MPLFITKVNSANTSVTFDYFESEHLFGFSVVGNYTFNILDSQYRDQDDVLIDGIDSLKEVYLKPNIVAKIGVDEFKNGLVTSISLPDDAHVKSTEASITIEEKVFVDSDSVLSDLVNNIPSPQDIQSLTENFSFSRSANSYTRTREISLKYKQDAGGDFLTKAYLFLKGVYLNSRPAYGFQEDGISENARFNTNFKPRTNETIDQINKEIRLSETLEINRVSQGNGVYFSEVSTYSLNLDQDGFTTKSYDVEVRALNEPFEINVASGIRYVINDLITGNSGEFGNPFSIEKSIRNDDGIASISIDFSNDPRKNNLNNIEYSASKTKDGAYDQYNFSLDITSRAQTRIEAFDNARNYWQSNSNLGYIKIPNLFPEMSSGDLFEKSRSVNFNPFQRNISESVIFSTNPAYSGDGSNIIRRSIQIDDNFGVDRYSVVAVLGNKEVAGLRGAGKTVGTRSVSVNLTSNDFSSLENEALTYATGEIPNANYYFLDQKTTSFNPYEGTSQATINYLFFD